MNTALKGCLLLAIVAAPAFAAPSEQPSNAMNCPMMSDQMQKQMSTMMTDMENIIKGSSDPAAKSRMQAMRERMSAMMANMQKMHGGMRPAPGASEPPVTAVPNAEQQDHEAHHPRP